MMSWALWILASALYTWCPHTFGNFYQYFAYYLCFSLGISDECNQQLQVWWLWVVTHIQNSTGNFNLLWSCIQALKTDTTLQGNKLVKECLSVTALCRQIVEAVHRGSQFIKVVCHCQHRLQQMPLCHSIRESLEGNQNERNVLKTLRPGDLKGSVPFVRESL